MPDTDFQKITLNLIPKQGDAPVVFYASQYETARPFIAELFWGETEFVPGVDCWAEIDIRKNDDNLLVITDDVTLNNNEVSVVLPVQAVTCIGKNLGQIKLYADVDHMVAAFNFILEVQPDPLAGGVQSETAIDNLESQVAAIVPVVIGNDYYNKTETDALLADKADVSDLPDMTNYYNKTETDALLADKADVSDLPDMTDYYNKTETDNLLSAKANTADLATVATTGDYDDLINKPSIPAAQIQSDYAQADNTQVDYIKNKPDIAGMIADAIFNILPVGGASGNPCSFDTEIAADIQSLSAEIVATGGGGTPGVPIPIVGYSEINLDVNGDTFTAAFGQTVYGGVYDKSGRLTCTWILYEDGFTQINQNNGYKAYQSNVLVNAGSTTGLCNIIDEFGFFDASNMNKNIIEISSDHRIYVALDENVDISTLQLIYELATPIEIDVSSVSPSAVVGTNTITSDCNGDVTVSYKDSIQHYIDNQ